MRVKTLLIVTCAVLIVSGCSTSKVITSPKTEIETVIASGDYLKATELWKQYFNEVTVESTKAEDFAEAAKVAFKAGDSDLAKSWFDQARYKSYADAEMYETLAQIYKKEDNLSKELSALEYYLENYGTDNESVNSRLFALYVEIDSNDKALVMWNKMDVSSQSAEKNLSAFLDINGELGNNLVCDSISLLLIDKNPKHLKALEWNAKKYYWAGQKRYEREMAKYNAKKTRKNYSILLKELDLVTADFKKALPYLKTLWELDPGKEYAGYLANIYARFGDKKKTAYYKNHMNK